MQRVTAIKSFFGSLAFLCLVGTAAMPARAATGTTCTACMPDSAATSRTTPVSTSGLLSRRSTTSRAARVMCSPAAIRREPMRSSSAAT